LRIMAKATLQVSSEAREAFQVAQNGGIRTLIFGIEGESINLIDQIPPQGNDEEDFNALSQHLEDSQARFVLFRTDDSTSNAAPWALIAFVPEIARVRDKMLYSASRDHLKRVLGQGFFQADYPANEKHDLQYGHFLASRSKREGAPLTESEILRKEEDAMEKDKSIRSNAMGIVLFQTSNQLNEALALFVSGQINWIEMFINMEDESVGLELATQVDLSQSVVDYVPESDPRFFIVRQINSIDGSNNNIFIYYCPEHVAVRKKMTYSTCKATILALTEQSGISFQKTLEIRDREDFAATFAEETTESVTDSPSVSVGHAKPTRPGKGRARLVKKAEF